jgi:hypothetical protein
MLPAGKYEAMAKGALTTATELHLRSLQAVEKREFALAIDLERRAEADKRKWVIYMSHTEGDNAFDPVAQAKAELAAEDAIAALQPVRKRTLTWTDHWLRTSSDDFSDWSGDRFKGVIVTKMKYVQGKIDMVTGYHVFIYCTTDVSPLKDPGFKAEFKNIEDAKDWVEQKKEEMRDAQKSKDKLRGTGSQAGEARSTNGRVEHREIEGGLA